MIRRDPDRGAPADPAGEADPVQPAGRLVSLPTAVAIMDRETGGHYGSPVDRGMAGAWVRRPAGVATASTSVPADSTAPDSTAETSTATAETARTVEPTKPAETARTDTATATDTSVDPVSERSRLLLRLMVANQERAHRHLCDVFHDGPIQDFTAVLLACSAVRRALAGPEAERLADIEAQLHSAIATLRLPSPAFRASNDARMILESALMNQVRGPLARTLEMELEVDDAAPTRAEVAELLGAIQLLLLESDPLRPAAQAAVTVRSGRERLVVALRVTPDPMSAAASPDVDQDAEARTERLGRIAELTGARITEEAPGGTWQAALAWPRAAPLPPNAHSRIEQRPGLAAYQAGRPNGLT